MFGVCYLLLEILDFYGLVFRERIYSADPVWFCAMKVKLAAATHASHSCTAVNLP